MTYMKLTAAKRIVFFIYLFVIQFWKNASFQTKVGNDSNLLIVFYVQIMPDDFVMQLHRF
ncbi:Permease, cytosine/purine, uracil, thiamine, allantoin family [Escherichia coli]|nr:hypothetical protein C3991_00171 [Escherichia coli]SQQ35353.1 Permease, cytosine/purine, uracil, thiamine, allantoin family [Escherichia coli]SQZ58381.1 Permease, cytosine/purine, uracil, thiamine, allantoin family [Escherichia coli]SRY89377.1 Permease, cytosine/purine, uracil, thiamine, allantoin family [Escherichia coli]